MWNRIQDRHTNSSKRLLKSTNDKILGLTKGTNQQQSNIKSLFTEIEKRCKERITGNSLVNVQFLSQ